MLYWFGVYALVVITVSLPFLVLYAVVAASRLGLMAIHFAIRSLKNEPLLNRFMPSRKVVDRDNVRNAAPAEVALSAATEIDSEGCPAARQISKRRELILRSKPNNRVRPRRLVANVRSLWAPRRLPGREIVIGTSQIRTIMLPAVKTEAGRQCGVMELLMVLLNACRFPSKAAKQNFDRHSPDECIEYYSFVGGARR